MAVIAAPTDAERAAGRVFDALMWALARPGERSADAPAMEAIGICLLDLEVSFFAPPGALAGQLARTGARPVDAADADYVFLPSADDVDPALLAQLRVGEHLYPDTGATLFVPGRIGAGVSLRISGPGVPGTRTIEIAGLPASFWEARNRACAYPLGLDVFVVGDGVIGFPRSTMIEVL
jgi:alpha-D-ribose 1-methylphosphonate 5-triphosphate synthase subunit PhnH